MKDQIERAIDLVLEQDQNEFLEFLKAQKRIIHYAIRPDGIVDVMGNVNLSRMHLTKIPVKFGIAAGWFDCSDNQLTSLEGAPEEVRGSFYCAANRLTSLEGAPEKVGRWFDCSDNQLTSLEGCPEEVEGLFDCSYNKLTTLRGCPKKVNGSFMCSFNQLTSLHGVPRKVNRDFNCNHNQLTTLRGCPEEVEGGFYCGGNPVRFTKEDIKLAKQGNAPLGLPLSFVLMKNKEKGVWKKKLKYGGS